MKNLFALLVVLVLIACGEDQTAAPVYDEPVAKIDTLVISNTDTIFVSELDTILVSNTDTLRVSLTDTVYVDKTDTITVKDIIELIDTLSIVDTMTIIDTVKDTVKVLVKDTVKIVDTVSVIDTVKMIDTVFVVSSSSSEVASSSSEESSSSIEEISSSSEVSSSSIEEISSSSSLLTIRDTISTFVVNGETFTVFSKHLKGDDDPYYIAYGLHKDFCGEIGGINATVSDIYKIFDTAVSAAKDTSNIFIGVRNNPKFEYTMICTADSTHCRTVREGVVQIKEFKFMGLQEVGITYNATYNTLYACKL